MDSKVEVVNSVFESVVDDSIKFKLTDNRSRQPNDSMIEDPSKLDAGKNSPKKLNEPNTL